MKTLSMTILSVLLLMGMTISSSQADLATTNQVTARMFNGTIDGIDPVEQLVVLRTTEQGQEVLRFLACSNGEVMKGLTKGDRVAVEVDAHGLARKIVKAGSDLTDESNPKN